MDTESNFRAVFLVRTTENSTMIPNEFGTRGKPMGIVEWNYNVV